MERSSYLFVCLRLKQFLNEENLRKQEESVVKQEAMRKCKGENQMHAFIHTLFIRS